MTPASSSPPRRVPGASPERRARSTPRRGSSGTPPPRRAAGAPAPRRAAGAPSSHRAPAATPRSHAPGERTARHTAGARPHRRAAAAPRARRTPPAPPPGRRAPAEPPCYALVVPGLEDLAAAELKRAGVTVAGTLSGFDRRDSIVVFSARDLRAVLDCGLIEDVFRVVVDAETPLTRGGVKALARGIDPAGFERTLLMHHELRPKRHGRTYKVVARVAGRHAFRRDEAEQAFASALGRLLPRWKPAPGAAAVELWVHVVGERTIAGLRVSGDELAGRAYKRAHLPASLKPTVARALVVLSEPHPDDVVLDPMCGAGTIVRERIDAGRAALVLGGDVHPASIAASKQNAGRGAALLRWDATRLPLRDCCIDTVITNPPYGRQHETTAGLDRLYARALREAARVLRPDGRCVVLTGEPAILTRAMPPALQVRSKRRLVVRGLSVTAFVMVRL